MKLLQLKWIIFGFCTNYVATFQTVDIPLRMPGVHPTKNDEYLQTSLKLDLNETYYIVKFQPRASMDIVHHMILTGCKLAVEGSGPGKASCLKDSLIFYAWARNATALILPEGVGFKIGPNSNVDYLVIQVHYGNISNIDAATGDTSGVEVTITNKQQPKRAGVFLMATGGCISSNTTENFETACKYNGNIPLHPFAFRTHTHTRGRLVVGYNIEHTSSGLLDWQLMGKKNPQLPQFFYPMENQTITIMPGNLLAARCTMQNNENRNICVGGTHMDEMCNFYTMYYVNGDAMPSNFGCYSAGPKSYYWETDPLLNNIPKDASSP